MPLRFSFAPRCGLSAFPAVGRGAARLSARGRALRAEPVAATPRRSGRVGRVVDGRSPVAQRSRSSDAKVATVDAQAGLSRRGRRGDDHGDSRWRTCDVEGHGGAGEAGDGASATTSFPALTRAGCNSGACHGALAGKGGMKLSLRGYDPESDHFVLTRQALGRRVDLTEARPRA